jgi:hypothetical protein
LAAGCATVSSAADPHSFYADPNPAKKIFKLIRIDALSALRQLKQKVPFRYLIFFHRKKLISNFLFMC